MQTNRAQGASPVPLTAFVLAVSAAYNYVTGGYGGTIVSSIDTVVTALFGSLTQP